VKDTIICGDSLETLKTFPNNSVNCCITSPPYWGLRDYGVEGQLGLEKTPEEYVAKMIDVFREVRRVLCDDGTLWLNLGDSYAAQRGGTYQPAETLAGGVSGKTNNGDRVNRDRHDGYNPTRFASRIGLKHKDLIGIPWRVAFALQADGWYLRQDIIWHKPNPMPESVTDRCTKSHEYVFLMAKSQKYFYDSVAIAEESLWFKSDVCGGKGNIRYEGKRTQGDPSKNGQQSFVTINPTRNRRSVWTIATQPFKEAHFAVFPPDLIKPMILAGCPEGGTVLDPFMGSGTTAITSMALGRHFVGIELNPEYAEMARCRVAKTTPSLFVEVTA
jgi:DNA modification methylase